MPTKEIVQPRAAELAESLRAVAALIEEHDWLPDAQFSPTGPSVMFVVKDADDVRLWAALTGARLWEGDRTTQAHLRVGSSLVTVAHARVDEPRVLHRPTTVTETLAERDQ